MNEVTSLLKEKVECPCTDERCDKFGMPTKKLGHVKGCVCISCRNGRNARKGNGKGRRARKALAIAGANSRHEELWGGALRVEVKAGGQIAPAYTAFLRCEAQSEAARPVGDHRPFAAIFMPDGTSDGVITCRLSHAVEVAAALLENFGAAS